MSTASPVAGCVLGYEQEFQGGLIAAVVVYGLLLVAFVAFAIFAAVTRDDVTEAEREFQVMMFATATVSMVAGVQLRHDLLVE